MGRTGTHVIVVGNEKGGSGKSTTAFHLAIYLLYQGFRVASIDCDSRQQTFTQYVRNRRNWMQARDLKLPHTTHFHLPVLKNDSARENQKLEFDLFRQAVIEVVRHDRASDTYIIVSGFGSQVDWYRNIQKTPDVVVQTGTRRLAPVAEPLPREAAADELHDYARRYPGTFRAITTRLLGREVDGSAEAYRQLAAEMPVVALRPRR